MERQTELGVLLPKGKNIYPVTTKLFRDRGINTGEGRKNGSLHGHFENFQGTWTQADSGNIIKEVERGTHHQVGVVGSDFLADYVASLREGESPRVVELDRFDLFDERTRVSVVGRANEYYHSPADFRGKRFIGRYPSLMTQLLRPHFPGLKKIPVEIDTSITGGEEGLVKSGTAIAAMVIVKTGGTLRREGLKELAVVEEHVQPVLVANLEAIQEMGIKPSLDELVNRLRNGKKGSSRWSLASIVSTSFLAG